MKYLGYFTRLAHLLWVWVKYDLDEIVLALPWLRPVRFIAKCNPVRWCRPLRVSQGERLRLALESLGPVYVKVGQMLSTRRDLLPAEVANALAKLQDHVKPFSGLEAQRIVEKALGQPIAEIFHSFSLTPLASASVAQVHEAVLKTGEAVVVKVIRPGILQTLHKDFALFFRMARTLSRLKAFRRLKPVALVQEMQQTILDELDLLREASNASQLKRNNLTETRLYIPEVYWQYCSSTVLVLERIYGIPVSDLETLKGQATQAELKALAESGVELFYKQVFQDCFFHADMHPGNLFVSLATPGQPQFIAVDFGIMGSLSKQDKNYLAANFLAFFQRNYRKVAELHIECGWVPCDTRVDQFEAALRMVCEPIFSKPLRDISCGQTLMRLFQIARRFHMEVMPQLLLLQKTLINIEGMGRALYPDLDLWATAKPYLEKWMRSHVGLKGFLKRTREELPFISERLPDLPRLLYQVAQKQAQPRIVADSNEVRKSGSRHGLWFLVFGILLLFVGLAPDLVDSAGQVLSWFILHRHLISMVGILLGGFGLLRMLRQH